MIPKLLTLIPYPVQGKLTTLELCLLVLLFYLTLPAQVLYSGSQPLSDLPTTSAWAAAWLQNFRSTVDFPANPAPLLKLTPESRAKLMSAASLHPAVSEVLRGLAVIPGMPLLLQCTQGPAYARILAQADLGIPLGPQQVRDCR